MARALDRYLTREPQWENIAECGCGAELNGEPFDVTYEEKTELCDGKLIEVHGRYGENGYDEGIIAVLGEEIRGTEYVAHYSPCMDYSGVNHEPHEMVLAVKETQKFLCAECGRITETENVS